jgi:hypothetical protein
MAWHRVWHLVSGNGRGWGAELRGIDGAAKLFFIGENAISEKSVCSVKWSLLYLSHRSESLAEEKQRNQMKTGKEISKEVRKLTTPEAQQAYINALTEQEAVAFAVYLLR